MAAQHEHPCQRYLERYGSPLSPMELAEVEGLIRRGKGMLLRRRKNTETWVVCFRSRMTVAVFDPEKKMVVTFLGTDSYKQRPVHRR